MTDSLTDRQIEQKHGEVYTMNINKPMLWVDFKKLPVSMGVEYYNMIVERFGVGAGAISEMFGISEQTVRKFLLSAANSGKEIKRIVGKPSVKNMQRFHDWWADEPEAENPEELPAIAEETEVRCSIASYHLSFEGVQDWNEIIKVVGPMPLPKGAVISIDVQRWID